MTYGIRNVVTGLAWIRGDKEKRAGFFGTKKPLWGAGWANVRLCRTLIEKGALTKDWCLADIYVYLWGAHTGHALEFFVALFNYWLFYADGSWVEEAKEWHTGWVSRIVLFNLCCELVFCNFWHYWSYASDNFKTWVEGGIKYNPVNQYEPEGGKNNMFSSSSGHLEREITFTTLGWLQSSGWQCLFTHLWACEILPCYFSFWSYPGYSLLVLASMTYWREVHFFFAHRGIHPWWDRKYGLLDGDIGAFLYRHVHSLHHKSYNPGPWSGLCMHPVEHFLYYSCATIPPLILSVHPLHFLYTKFHADIAPIGGHDGMDEPGGKGDFHWLHHAKFECNYGVPFPINLDLLCGTWADYDVWRKTGELTVSAWAKGQMHDAEDEEGVKKKNVKEMPALAETYKDEANVNVSNVQETEINVNGKREAEAESPDETSAKRAKVEDKNGTYTMDEIRKHSSHEDCWIVLYGKVFDVTKFLGDHPGGAQVILGMAGEDVTDAYEAIHHASGGFELVARHCPDAEIGVVEDYDGPAPPDKTEQAAPMKWPGVLFFFPALCLAAAGAVAL